MNATRMIIAGAAGFSLAASAAAAPAGTVLWALELDNDPISKSATVGPDGTIYIHAGDLYAVDADGTLKWRRTPPITNGVVADGPVGVDAAGNVYVSTPRDLSSYDPDGNLRWTFEDHETLGVIAGPGVGPDGNIYQVNTTGPGRGVFSLDPSGSLRWSLEDPGYFDRGLRGHEVAFGGGNVYFSFDNRGLRLASMDAVSLDGDYEFGVQVGGECEVVTAPDGDAIFSQNNVVYRYNPDGSQQFAFGVGGDPSAPCVDDDGNTYFFTFQRFLYKLDPQGELVWQRTYNGWGIEDYLYQSIGGAIAPGGTTMVLPAFDPDRDPSTIRGLDINTGDELWSVELPVQPGSEFDYIASGTANAVFSADGTVAYVPVSSFFQNWLYAVQVVDAPEDLVADLDGDGSVGSGDLAVVLGAWGPCQAPGSCPADLDGDGAVGSSDLAIALGAWGPRGG